MPLARGRLQRTRRRPLSSHDRIEFLSVNGFRSTRRTIETDLEYGQSSVSVSRVQHDLDLPFFLVDSASRKRTSAIDEFISKNNWKFFPKKKIVCSIRISPRGVWSKTNVNIFTSGKFLTKACIFIRRCSSRWTIPVKSTKKSARWTLIAPFVRSSSNAKINGNCSNSSSIISRWSMVNRIGIFSRRFWTDGNYRCRRTCNKNSSWTTNSRPSTRLFIRLFRKRVKNLSPASSFRAFTRRCWPNRHWKHSNSTCCFSTGITWLQTYANWRNKVNNLSANARTWHGRACFFFPSLGVFF